MRYNTFTKILNIFLLVRLNSHLYNITSKCICALTTGYSKMNQMKCDRKSWEDIRIQVSLCKMNTFIGTTAIVKTLFFFEYAIYSQKWPLCPVSTNILFELRNNCKYFKSRTTAFKL